MPLTLATSKAVRALLFGGVPIPIPQTWYIGLSRTDPKPSGKGVSEPWGITSNYRRVSLHNQSELYAVKGHTTSNKRQVVFPVSMDWGEIAYALLWDASQFGQLVAYAELDKPIKAIKGTIIGFMENDLSWTL